MSGSRLLLDTNAVVRLLRGEGGLEASLRSAQWVGISIISYLEFLSFPQLVAADEALFADFCERVETIGLTLGDAGLVAAAIRVRREAGLKLPDAIIAATALTHNAMLVTADGDFARVAGLRVSSLP
jgi:hypothetical protein